MSIGSTAAAGPNPTLMALLSQLTGTQSASADTSPFTQTAAGTSGTSQAGTANNALTGSGSASLSSEILNLLNQMRQHVSAGGGTSASTTTSSTSASTLSSPLDQLMSSLDASLTASASTSTMATPLQQLFSSMDGDDDGGENEFPGTAVGGATGASAPGGFEGLHSGGSGRFTTAGLTQTWENLQNSQPPGSPSLLNAFANSSIGAATSSVMA
jgi:hypothetical protein